jgi:hypothetical protein
MGWDLPCGHVSAQPLRLQEPQGISLSHRSLSLRHSAQDASPRVRLYSSSSSDNGRLVARLAGLEGPSPDIPDYVLRVESSTHGAPCAGPI